ncbi:hypothetical protein PAXRUDRAFT_834196, partial [Paxillus rubicundulus Ve08.2h10]
MPSSSSPCIVQVLDVSMDRDQAVHERATDCGIVSFFPNPRVLLSLAPPVLAVGFDAKRSVCSLSCCEHSMMLPPSAATRCSLKQLCIYTPFCGFHRMWGAARTNIDPTTSVGNASRFVFSSIGL